MKPERIFVPTDFSDAAEAAIRRAVALCMLHGAHLHVLHVVLLHEEDPARLERKRIELESLIAGIMDGWPRTDAAGTRPPVRFSTRRDVATYPAVMAELHEVSPDLVVVGTHGGGLLLGTLAEHLIRHARCNVLVCRPDSVGDWPATRGRVIVPVDFSDPSRRALMAARTIGRAGSPIDLLHVVAVPSRPRLYGRAVPTPFELDPTLEDRVRAELERWADGPVDEITVLEGDPAPTIVEHCRRRDGVLVVMGTRGLSGFRHFLVGSVAEKVARTSPAPVLAAR